MATQNEAKAKAEVVRCVRCGCTWSAAVWRALPTERTLTRVDVLACVRAWPEGTVVEVRACTRCGGAIARATAAPTSACA